MDAVLEHTATSLLNSPIEGVSNDAWSRFVRVVAASDPLSVSESNALGMFRMTPRRLADLEVVRKLRRDRERGIWTAEFVPPLTCARFLRSPRRQYEAFAASMRDYDERMRSGEIIRDADMSLAGALVILHCVGPSGLEQWRRGRRFSATSSLFNRVFGIF